MTSVPFDSRRNQDKNPVATNNLWKYPISTPVYLKRKKDYKLDCQLKKKDFVLETSANRGSF